MLGNTWMVLMCGRADTAFRQFAERGRRGANVLAASTNTDAHTSAL